MFKKVVTLQAWVVLKVNNAIQQALCVVSTNILVYLMAIHLVDNVIQPLNDWGRGLN